MAIVSKKCNRCRRPLRNDGTEQNPKWVCNNPSCVRYVPPQPKPDPERKAVRDEINKLQAELETK